MKTINKVSIIMSVYNGEKYLAEAIESILNQTFRDFEFIIINDNSTDNSLKIIRRYQQKDKRIKLVNNSQNIGLTKSLNIGLKIAKGKYIARMDADDISLPMRLQIQVSFLEENPQIFLVGTGAIKINELSQETGRFKPTISKKILKQKIKITNCIYHPTIMFRNTGDYLYNEKFKYAQDYDLYLRLIFNRMEILNMDNYLLKYRSHKESISQDKLKTQKYFKRIAQKDYFFNYLKSLIGQH